MDNLNALKHELLAKNKAELSETEYASNNKILLNLNNNVVNKLINTKDSLNSKMYEICDRRHILYENLVTAIIDLFYICHMNYYIEQYTASSLTISTLDITKSVEAPTINTYYNQLSKSSLSQ